MRRFAQLLLLLFSLHLIHSGSGVMVVSYCCDACQQLGETVLEADGCHEVHHGATCHENDFGKDNSCQGSLKKLQLKKLTTKEVTLPDAPVLDVLDALLPTEAALEQCYSCQTKAACTLPLPPLTSRYYLNLYAVLLI